MVINFLKEQILSKFGVSKTIISNGGSHFCTKVFDNLIRKIISHIKYLYDNLSYFDLQRLAILTCLCFMVYCMAYKTPLIMSPYQIVYEKD